MIEGLRLDMKGTELQAHAKSRTEYHKSRADIYEAEYTKIVQMQRDADDTIKQISKTSNAQNPADQIESSAKSHRRKERFFRFASEHFVLDDTYRLKMEDLEAFEIAPSNRGY